MSLSSQPEAPAIIRNARVLGTGRGASRVPWALARTPCARDAAARDHLLRCCTASSGSAALGAPGPASAFSPGRGSDPRAAGRIRSESVIGQDKR